MADDGIVALREAVSKILETDHADLLRDGVALLYREFMEAEALTWLALIGTSERTSG